MKLIKIILALSVLFIISCNDAPKRGDAVLEEGYEPSPIENTTATTTPTSTPTPEPAQNAEGVWHYTCPNGCEGGAGAAGPCPGCGATLAHNSGYHNNNVATTPSTNPIINTDGGEVPNLQTNPIPEPAQNASGVWHYTCPNGCEGGAGAAGPCPGCGATLAHNTGYHN